MTAIGASALGERIDLAHRLADCAAAITRPAFLAADIAVHDKGAARFDPVTDADRAAETAMRDLLRSQVPDDSVHAEEFGDAPGASGWRWSIDPIDGTRAFIVGSPTWTTLIGLSYGEERVFGLIDQPILGERYWGDGQRGEMRRNGRKRPLAARASPSRPAEFRLATTDYFLFSEDERKAFRRLQSDIGLIRYGLDGYAYALLSCGRLDLVVEAGLEAHDMEALPPIVAGAGGLVTDWQGDPPGAAGGRIIAAGDRAALEAALNILSAVC